MNLQCKVIVNTDALVSVVYSFAEKYEQMGVGCISTASSGHQKCIWTLNQRFCILYLAWRAFDFSINIMWTQAGWSSI